ncbi:MAG: transposase [Bacteroidales bacterium]|nr:transposase [Bacteroidales bacterium]
MHNEKQQSAAAAKFAKRWKGKGYERGESQLFWTELLTEVYGIENPSEFIRYEERVESMVDSTNFIDGHIPSTRVLIEQKSLGKDLRAPVPQSEGGKLTPYQQAKKYIVNMPLSQHPRWVVTCNFAEFLVYDMEFPNGEPESILLKDMGKEYYRLQFLVDANSEHITKEMRVSMQAGEIVGRIYDTLLKQYGDSTDETLRWLNILCVRIVFCLYAEDAHIFRHDQFHDFLAGYNANDLRQALRDLFVVLNTPLEKRSRYLKDDLKAFPYTNGGLFEEEIEIPQFTEEVKQTLLQNASLDFDWSDISPTIFGAMFESTLNPETRRSGGMHYTSIENIHKVIDPLFLNDLRQELDDILAEKVEKQRQRKLDEYQDKLASLTFLDPACGSGNFLTETYLCLRRLENQAIRERYHGQMMMGEFKNPVKVSIHQFYGIEINDFAVTVATTALWISEAQMLAETERIIQHDIDFLPLKSYANIREGNALRMDWLGVDASKRRDNDTSSDVDASKCCDNDNTDAWKRQFLSNAGSVGSLQFMERDKYINITGSTLPHWHQDNKVQFVTFRLADSLPQVKLAELSNFKEEWLRSHPEPWSQATQEEYDHIIRRKVDKWLDHGYGECILQSEDIRKIVVDALLFYHGKRYILHHFVIMPNHVHLLITPIGDDTVMKSIGSVKQFTANAINKLLGRSGEVWQRNVFDRMVRDANNYEKYVQYINQNPCNLLPDCYTLGGDASERRNDEKPDASEHRENVHPDIEKHFEVDGSDAQKHRIQYNYIMGNPPFVGARMMSAAQKDDLLNVFGNNWKNIGNLDYVSGWYKKAADLLHNSPKTKVALVSTNSITQGEQVANLWKPLLGNDIQINFAYRTFRWDSESEQKAHVHCVIIGFSSIHNSPKEKLIFEDNGNVIKSENINAYLLNATNVFIESRKTPLCDVSEMVFGNMPNDGGNLIIKAEEYEDFIKKEPAAKKYVREFLGAEEFINGKKRYCLWLVEASPAELRHMPLVAARVEAVRKLRMESKREATKRLAYTPHLFGEIRQPESGNYLLVPSVSSEKRRYVPIGFLPSETIASNLVLIIPNATLYEFGILTSIVHNAWMRVVCGRLESRYRYSVNIVYNNFPWPGVDASKRRENDGSDAWKRRLLIEQTAKAILDARAKYPDSTLADLYDETFMPADLRKTHQANDRAVMEAYGFDPKMTENQMVAELFRLYKELTHIGHGQ